MMMNSERRLLLDCPEGRVMSVNESRKIKFKNFQRSFINKSDYSFDEIYSIHD